MKIRSLLLGSIAAAGLSTGAYAADLGVLTSLDVCDALGISGLTISSDTNCLQITGKVSYEFLWGDYKGPSTSLAGVVIASDDNAEIVNTPSGTADIPHDGFDATFGASANLDWRSKYEAWLKVVATADSDFGPAKATIRLKSVERYESTNEIVSIHGDTTNGVVLDEAYVSVGDSTIIMAGLRRNGNDGTIGNFGDDTSYNYLNLFNEKKVDSGVLFPDDSTYFGGHAIQVVSDLGNGVSVGAALENINDTNGAIAGTLLGVVSYAGEGLTAHVTGGAIGVLDGAIDTWFVHAGATASFDAFKLRGAVGYWRSDLAGFVDSDLDVLVSGEATFDLFTIALSGEFARTEEAGATLEEGWGVGGSIGAQVTDGVALNVGARWFHNRDNTLAPADVLYEEDLLQIAGKVVASVTETVTLTGEVGGYFNDSRPAIDGVFYGAAEVKWAPGGGFESSVKGEAFSNGAYRGTFKASKSFE